MFDQIIGHERIKKILSGILDQRRIPQGMIWTGPEGIGKAKLARLFARAVLCAGAGERPCEECPACQRSSRGASADIIELELGRSADEDKPAAAYSIERIRELADEVAYGPRQEKYLICLVPDADKLTEEAADCFLKLLEEPPGKVVFILTTAQPAALPATVLSRCQILYFSPLSSREAAQILEKSGWPEAAARPAAEFTLGNLTLLDPSRDEKSVPSGGSLAAFFPGGIGREPERIFKLASELGRPGADRADSLRCLAWLILEARQLMMEGQESETLQRSLSEINILLDSYELVRKQANLRLLWEATFLKLSKLEK